MPLKLHKFDPRPGGVSQTGLRGCLCVLVGKRNTGKSVLTKDLIFHLQDMVDLAVCISPTESANEGFRRVVPPSFIFQGPDEEHLERLMEFQRKQKQRGKPKQMLLIIDDAAWKRSYFESNAFKKLCFNGRHWNMTVIVTLQYCKSIPPAIRSQADLVMQLNEKQLSSRRAFHDNFCGMTSFEEMCAIMDKTTVGFEALVVWNRSRSNNLDETLFWYCADIDHANSARLCADKYWILAEHYDAESGDDRASTAALAQAKAQLQVGAKVAVIDKLDDNGKTYISA